MKFLLKAFLLITFTQAAQADYLYECQSSQNAPIFEVGSSSTIELRISDENIFISNKGGSETLFSVVSRNKGYAFFSSLSLKSNSGPLVAIIPEKFSRGPKEGGISLLKENTDFEQRYVCELLYTAF